jgi:hypothetical protein
MFAFLVETYLQGVDGAHPYERIENTVVTVHNQISDRIKADYTHLFMLAYDQHDPRSNLWNALYSLFSCHGVSEEHFALAMRCIIQHNNSFFFFLMILQVMKGCPCFKNVVVVGS